MSATFEDDDLVERGRTHFESRRAEQVAPETGSVEIPQPEPRRPWLHVLVLIPAALALGVLLAYLFAGTP